MATSIAPRSAEASSLPSTARTPSRDQCVPISSNSTSFADPSRPRPSNALLLAHPPGSDSPDSVSSASSASTCASTRPHAVVPQYPYNVSMPQFQGSLHSNDRTPVADDSDVQTRLPSICVDYLSHDWDESDVWASWKVMTRHKNELVNGVRLENASWRTWAKQRNNLKTISPETLNWLKDSDVTWLYGPLHTAVDPVPPPKQATVSDRLTLDTATTSKRAVSGINTAGEPSMSSSTSSPRPTSAMGHRLSKLPGKPILKHRSLSEILGVNGPVSPPASEPTSVSATEDDADASGDDNSSGKRVLIAPAGSDSTLTDRLKASDTLQAPEGRSRTASADGSVDGHSGDDSDARGRSGSRQTSGSDDNGNGRRKKHISFSHRVEQCIAVDSSEEERGFRIGPDDDDDDGEDEEDDMLMFRTASALRHHPRHQFIKRGESNVHASGSNDNGGSLTTADPVTITRMAPTTLKSAETYPAPSPAVIFENDTQPVWQPNVVPPIIDDKTPEPIESFVPSYLVRTFGSGGSIDSASGSNVMNTQYYSSSSKPSVGLDATAGDGVKNRWEDDSEDFSTMGFDYFSGPDLGVGDEYDMPSLPSQHLASGGGYLVRGNMKSSFESTPSSSGASTPATIKARDSSDTLTPPKSILKQIPGVDAPLVKVASPSSPVDVPGVAVISGAASAISASSQNTSPQNPNFPTDATQTESGAGPPSPLAERPDRRSRGRSSSRGSSSSSFERSTGADRRPSSSPSPPGTVGPHIGSAVNRSSGSGTGVRYNRQGNASNYSLESRSGSSNSLAPDDNRWVRGTDEVEDGVTYTRSGKGSQAMNGSDTSVLRAKTVASKSRPSNGLSNQEDKVKKIVDDFDEAVSPVNSHSVSASDTSDDVESEERDKVIGSTLRKSGRSSKSNSSRLLSAPRPASTHLADDSDNEHLFDSPHMPSSPTTSEMGTSGSVPKRNSSFSSMSTMRWSDDTPVSIARRSLLRQYSPTFRDPRHSVPSSSNSVGHATSRNRIGRAFSDDEAALRRLSQSGDDFGFGYGGYSDEEDVGGVVGRATEMLGTAKDLVGALWTVGSRSLWGKNNLSNQTQT